MASYGQTLRRGLPRRPGGDPWPPAGEAPAGPSAIAEPAVSSCPAAASAAAPAEAATSSNPSTGSRTGAGSTSRIRRGLPRVPGGGQWPPVSTIVAVVASATPSTAPIAFATTPPPAEYVEAPVATASTSPTAGAPSADSSGRIRRGMPRVPGGDAWPPEGFAPAAPAIAQQIVVDTAEPGGTAGVAVAAPSVDVSTPLPFTRTVWQGAAAERFEAERRAGTPIVVPEPKRYGPFNRLQWAGAVVVGGGGLLFAGLMVVFAVRWLVSLEPMQEWLATYPGEYHLPEGAPIGIPAWLGWQHFFNVFLMVLIIRSGLRVRSDKRPTAFWAPRTNANRKISLTLWLHQSLDILWIVNGVVFVVLLFVSGQWMRVIPTSWEVFPNALSAALRYVSLDWPTENGWVNYNALQQLAYFTTIFIAAPVAILTGVRMSGVWPKNARTLNRIYPVEWARAVHFPTMIYFVLFIFLHVVLVFATGALRNLNHMYAAQGSPDPNAYAMNWTGFWIFGVSMLAIAGAWIAARPLVLAPIARLFGNVSGR